jgi:uncharacterized protein
VKIFITGATGFIGKALVLRLQRDGHRIVAWTRDLERARGVLGPEVELADASGGVFGMRGALAGCEAAINLAGENLVGGRWTARRKRALVQSRVELTRRLVGAIGEAARGPRVLVSASGIDYYGDRGDDELEEASGSGDGFLAELCRDWEEAAGEAQAHGVRVAIARIGVVLGQQGGALAKLLTPFRLGLGGPLGSGESFMPWIHLHDLVDALALAVTDARIQGAFNAVAPEPVRGREFAHALGEALRRPARLRVPSAALGLALGEAAAPLCTSKRAVPAALTDWGFSFRFASLRGALDDLVHADRDVHIERRRGHYRLSLETVVHAPLEEVFEFFSQAENLGVITPPRMAFSIRSERPVRMEEGARIDYRIKLGPVPMRWRSHIAAWEPGARFVDVQERGPYRAWHHEHLFRAEGDSTVVEDYVDYAPPLGPLGRLVNRLMIARELRGIFGYRSDAIRLRFGHTPRRALHAA